MVLLLVALLAMSATRAIPFLDDIPELAKTAIATGGAACLLTGVWLWLRKAPEASRSDQPDGPTRRDQEAGAGTGVVDAGRETGA